MAEALAGDELVAAARAIAQQAHAGAADKAGRPYIDHARRVAERLPTRQLQAVGWLHDVVEDTGTTLADLHAAGIPDAVCVAVDAVSNRQDESHEAAVRRAAADPLGRAVKAADVTDNADPQRLALLDAGVAAGLVEKYTVARRVLAEPAAALYGDGRRTLVVDDLRIFADLPAAAYARTSGEALALLAWHVWTGVHLDELWLDHDLGPDDDIRPVVGWLEELWHTGVAVPVRAVVAHSANPVGATEVVRALGRWVSVRRVDAATMSVRNLGNEPPTEGGQP